MPEPFPKAVIRIAEALKQTGWRAFKRNTMEKKIGSETCMECKARNTITGLGFGLQYCRPCKIAIDVSASDGNVNRVVAAYWDGNLYSASLYELVSKYPEAFAALTNPSRHAAQ